MVRVSSVFKGGDSTWEGNAIIVIVLGLLLLPPITGWVVIKLYRRHKPIEQDDDLGFTTQLDERTDGFFKMLLVGWVIWLPILLWFYQSYLA